MNSVKPIHKQMGSVLTITRGRGDNKKGARTSQWMQNEQTCHQYWPQTIKNWPQTLADHFNPIHSLSSRKRMNYILTTFLLLFFDKKLSHLLLLLLQKSCKNKHQPNCFDKIRQHTLDDVRGKIRRTHVYDWRHDLRRFSKWRYCPASKSRNLKLYT